MNARLPAPQSILIIRLSAIGDVIMASALIPAIRTSYPNARLVWLTEEINACFLQSNPHLDRVLVWPRRYWKSLLEQRQFGKLARELFAAIKTMHEEKFDWVLDTQGLLKSGLWSLASGGKFRIGLGSREGSQYWMNRVIGRHTMDDRIGSEYYKLAKELELEVGDFAMDVAVASEDSAFVETLLKKHGVKTPFAVICPFTTRPQKHWFSERWSELSQRIQQTLGMQPIVVGSSQNRDEARAIAGRAETLIDLSGQTTLGQCAAIIEKASLLIGVDTGLTHLGIALNTPTLTLFGSTRPYLDTHSARARVLYEPLACSPCYRKPTCDGAYTCMQLHTVDSVLAAAHELLAGHQ